jgi:hypothetical protein
MLLLLIPGMLSMSASHLVFPFCWFFRLYIQLLPHSFKNLPSGFGKPSGLGLKIAWIVLGLAGFWLVNARERLDPNRIS